MNHNRILFITTKNVDYLRNVQEIRLLKEKNAEVTVIGSHSRKYLNRLFYVYRRLLTVKASDYREVFIGFAPQLVLPFWKKKFRKNTVVIDFFISMYDTLVNDRKVFSEKSVPAKLLRWLDRKTVECADQIIVDTNADGKYFEEEFQNAVSRGR